MSRDLTVRERLPNRRTSEQIVSRTGNKTVFATVGYYPDGRIGELFLDVGREGTEIRVLLNSVAQAVSLAIQHGCPINLLINVLKSHDQSHYNNIVAEILEEALDLQKES